MPDTIPLALTDDMREAIAGAFASGTFMTLGYIGPDGWPHLSPRGTAQVIDDQTLAVWARNPAEGLAASVADRPEVTLFHMLLQHGVLYTYYGKARVSTDKELTASVWDRSPEREQMQDPDRKGAAVVVDLVRIVSQSRHPERNFVMER